MHGEDGPRARGYGRRDFAGVDVGRARVDIHEHGLGAGIGNRFRRGDKSVRRGNDLVARLHAHPQQRQMQGAGPGIHRHAVLARHSRRQIPARTPELLRPE